jgi:hypothetical protein
LGKGESSTDLLLTGDTRSSETGIRLHYNDTLKVGVMDVRGHWFAFRGVAPSVTGDAATPRFLVDLNSGNVDIDGGLLLSDLAIQKESGRFMVFRDLTEPGDWWGMALDLAANTVVLNRGAVNILQDGRVGVGTGTPQARLEVNGAARLAPTGRPATAAPGTIYFDATAKRFFGFDGTTWKALDN